MMQSAPLKQITVLGSTGSIGANTLDVIAAHPDRYAVYALAARRSVELLHEQCLAHEPRYAVLSEADAAARLAELLPSGHPTQVLSGAAALEEVASATAVDAVMAAIVGAIGLPSALAAARAGKRVMLANKEALVMAGALFMRAVREAGAELLPIDSEHNAIFQCLPVAADTRPELSQVRRVLLTASGGPFRDWEGERLYSVTPEQACAHPNWSMGRKISVDSATLMNKGLELAEACWLFDIGPERIEVVVHPQSIVHSMVEYCDGSVLAQLGNPDMRTPIAYGLAWPERIESGVAPLDLIARGRLDFRPPDEARFPCLRLAREAIALGGTAMVVCNAANEIAVDAFLNDHIGFMDIPRAIEATLSEVAAPEPTCLAVVEEVDAEARRATQRWLARAGAVMTS